MCAGVLSLCLNDAAAKWLVQRYSPFQIIFVRGVLALPLIVALVLWADGKAALRTPRLGIHAFRGVLAVGATFGFFTGLNVLPLAEATSLVFAAPIFITALSVPLLRERVGWRRWTAVTVGLVGVLIIVRPGAAAFQTASLYVVGAAALHALAMITVRWVDERDNMRTMMLYLTVFPVLYCSFVVFTAWPAPMWIDLALFAFMAVLGTLGLTLISQAFRMAPAAVVAPFEYTALVWASGLGWLVWGVIPEVWVYAGAAVIVASGIFIILRESARKAAPSG